MKRIKFTIAGTHPLLYQIRRNLIVEKLMQLVEPSDNPDFAIVGASKAGADVTDTLKLFSDTAGITQDTPILLLSSSDVYSDKDDTGEVSESKPMSEDRCSVIPSVLDVGAPSALFSLTAESTLLRSHRHVLVLRTFEVYGSGMLEGCVHKALEQAKAGDPISITSPGYQTRTFLHQDDFFLALDKLIPKFLKGARGIYNIGSTEEVSLKRLADSIWQLTWPHGGATSFNLVQPKGRQVWWITPDITRIQVLLNWKPTITLRKGLWTLIGE